MRRDLGFRVFFLVTVFCSGVLGLGPGLGVQSFCFMQLLSLNVERAGGVGGTRGFAALLLGHFGV